MEAKRRPPSSASAIQPLSASASSNQPLSSQTESDEDDDDMVESPAVEQPGVTRSEMAEIVANLKVEVSAIVGGMVDSVFGRLEG